MAAIGQPSAGGGGVGDGNVKYWLIWPAVLILLLIGLFPIIYTLLVSFQNIM